MQNAPFLPVNQITVTAILLPTLRKLAPDQQLMSLSII